MDDIKRFQKFLNRYYNSHEFKDERLGQAFLNHFMPELSEPDPDLFYCSNDTQATKMIYDKYLHVFAQKVG